MACDGIPVVRGGQVFSQTSLPRDLMFSLDIESGTPRWARSNRFSGYDSPVVTKNRVFASGVAKTRAWNHDGTLVWSVDCCSQENGRGFGSALVRNRLYVGFDQAVLDPATGERIGSLGSDAPWAFADGLAFVVQDGYFRAVDDVTGEVRWEHLLPAGDHFIPPLVVGDTVYHLDRAGALRGYSVDDGAVVWEATHAAPLAAPFLGMAAAGGHLVVISNQTVTTYRSGGE